MSGTSIHISIDEKALKKLIIDHIQELAGDRIYVKPEDVRIEVKSKQNYKSEWETAAFRAEMDLFI